MKIKLNNPFYAVGEINKQIAREANIPAGGIFITKAVLEHIDMRHKEEIAKMHLSTEEFVSKVVANYSEIRKGSGDSYLLTVPSKRTAKVAAMSLEIRLDARYKFWLIKTAYPIDTRRITSKQLVYQKKKPAR